MLGLDINDYKGLHVDLTEFQKLCFMLNDAGIGYETKARLGGMGLAIPDMKSFSTEHDGNRTISVICHSGSYGREKGLLEIYAPGLNDGVEGWLTAEDAFGYVKDTLEGKSRGSCG